MTRLRTTFQHDGRICPRVETRLEAASGLRMPEQFASVPGLQSRTGVLLLRTLDHIDRCRLLGATPVGWIQNRCTRTLGLVRSRHSRRCYTLQRLTRSSNFHMPKFRPESCRSLPDTSTPLNLTPQQSWRSWPKGNLAVLTRYTPVASQHLPHRAHPQYCNCSVSTRSDRNRNCWVLLPTSSSPAQIRRRFFLHRLDSNNFQPRLLRQNSL
mmetsp:Transcript_57042/g.133838  ORF Transcript_57042/g.133838 Transcript_57042/m.133838 type:complete len:211 (+) Transcript_57042:165-797(+)